MADLLSLVPDLRTSIGNVPAFMVESEIKSVARDFFMRTEVWNTTYECDVSANDPSVFVNKPTGSALLRVVWLQLNGKKLRPIDEVKYYELAATPRLAEPEVYCQTVIDGTMVYPNPKQELVGYLNAVFYPDTGTSVPDGLFNLYRTTLQDGVQANLLMSATEWQDDRAGNYYWTRYQQGVEMARSRAFRGTGNVIREAVYGGY